MRFIPGPASYFALTWIGPRDHVRQTPRRRARRLGIATISGSPATPLVIGEFYSVSVPPASDLWGIDPDQTMLTN